MKTKIFSYLILATIVLTGCTEFLTPEPLATEKLSTYFKNDTAAVTVVNAAYVPLQWQLGGTYSNEWFVGDVVSDDALKGGASISDMQVVGLMENFQTTANNVYLESFYNINYQGIFRANFAMEQINAMPESAWASMANKSRLIGESKFLRAFYHFRLMRLFGKIIKGDRTFNQNDVQMARAPKADIVNFIRKDLDEAIAALPLKSDYPVSELGRATKGAAQAMLMRVLLFNILDSPNKTKDYERVMALGDSIIKSTQYTLCTNYSDIFKVGYISDNGTYRPVFVKENGTESVFEIQYMTEATSDYGGMGRTRGNFDPRMTRTRAGSWGWGFDRPTKDLYDAFETGDIRRDEAILPYDAGDVYGGDAEHNYYNGYHNRKTSLVYKQSNGKLTYLGLAHDTRSPENSIVIRYADVLLMYAEAACELNLIDEGKAKLNLVRLRAKNSTLNPADPTILPPFPYGTYTENQADLRAAIRHERRVEFAMEGQRWFDLVRWGIAGEVMNAYKEKYKDQEGKDMSAFVVGKNELFPIPETQLNANTLLDQNNGY
ncbi:MAG TPA: RagB/SusD family nutrient uptake outer membrane protein [Bacteroidales bacterium]|nr:RagB/SusD family nutrient uptake outer membrane protein [Bacteroidales bacterium]